METKQIYFDYKSMVHHNSIKRLIYFIHNLEEKLSSVKIIHDKLYELMSIVSKTHENIMDELITIKTVLNQTIIEQEEDEIISIDGTKSEWDDDDDDDEENQSKKLNKDIRQTDTLILNSESTSNESLTINENSLNKRLSNLKKSDQSLSRTKSPKSVSFSLDENIPNQQEKYLIEPIQQISNETKNQIFDEITSPIIASSSSDLSIENQSEITSNIGKISTNIRIHEIETKNGDYLRLLNISNSEDYDLSGHFLQQNISSKPFCRFRFPFNTIIRAGHTVTIWCGHIKDIIPQPPHIFVWKEQRKWETGPECFTFLAKPNGQSIAWFRNPHRVNTDQLSGDILFVHSKSNIGSSDLSSISMNSIKSSSRLNTKQNRFSSFYLNGNNKPPFAHSPNNPIHPDHNGTTINIPNDYRSQMHQKSGISQLLNRPKSSPFASHTGCKQDLISMNFLRKQQTQKHKQTTIKT